MERVRFEDIVTRVNTKEDRFNTDKITMSVENISNQMI